MTLKIGIATRFALYKVCLFVFIMVIGFYLPDAPLPVPAASATSGYGIQGQMAPELNLSNWIDGQGRKTEPIRLNDYRGKVVYMYFFQDW